MQIKRTTRYHYSPFRITIKWITDNTNAGKDVGQEELSCPADGNTK